MQRDAVVLTATDNEVPAGTVVGRADFRSVSPPSSVAHETASRAVAEVTSANRRRELRTVISWVESGVLGNISLPDNTAVAIRSRQWLGAFLS
ncbi:hypothetical protein [Nocardia sp. NPDC004260]